MHKKYLGFLQMGDYSDTKNGTIENIYNKGSLQSRITIKHYSFERCGKFKWCHSDNGSLKVTWNNGVTTKLKLFGIQLVKLWIISFEH